jgi:RHS repeat-associated protein
MLGVRVLHSDNSVTTRYFHTDHLGSIAVITDENGSVVERDSYDAWGKRRFPNGADDPTGSITSQTTRGFTGQEELTDVGLVHLNGRVYDPLIGRMMSADPFVPDPMNGQAWNRYSYVIDNPLAFTDPNGYCFLGMCSWGRAISTFFNRTFGSLFRQVPILGTIFEIAASGLCVLSAVCAPFAPAIAGLSRLCVKGRPHRLRDRHCIQRGGEYHSAPTVFRDAQILRERRRPCAGRMRVSRSLGRQVRRGRARRCGHLCGWPVCQWPWFRRRPRRQRGARRRGLSCRRRQV